uniref:CopG family ribbon-helix-helix protein n=1 Tax=Endozoicomonas sp. ONNA2 TaxID=2828741 RepID=UPI002149020C
FWRNKAVTGSNGWRNGGFGDGMWAQNCADGRYTSSKLRGLMFYWFRWVVILLYTIDSIRYMIGVFMSTSARTVRLHNEVSQAVDEIAQICGRDANFVMREAIEEYVKHHEWVIKETKRRLAKLEAGEAKRVPHDEVRDSILKRIQGKS